MDKPTNDILQILKARRSVYPKFFTDQEIDPELIWQILEAANWAPTHRMTEPWRFIVLQDQKLEELGDFLAEAYKSKCSEKEFNQRKYEEKRKKVLQSGAVIAIVMKRDPNGSLPEWEELAATACAVQNLWIAASHLGLGGYWSSPQSVIGRPGILPLEEGEECYGLFYLGHHAMPDIPRQREDIKKKVRWLRS